jgi:D-tyrosyl-tRNA(Tyr) deacylase
VEEIMRACIQRVSQAAVTVNGELVSRIGKGFLVLLGVGAEDTKEEAIKLAEKIIGLRVFEDQAGKMNLSLQEVGGEILVVSQFTLFADCRKGRRPSFTGAAPPELAEQLYEFFVNYIAQKGILVRTGRFREHMLVELVNDGPVTIWLDSKEL